MPPNSLKKQLHQITREKPRIKGYTWHHYQELDAGFEPVCRALSRQDWSVNESLFTQSF